MKFSEQKAQEIVQTFALSKFTINTWRQRNAIPERYKNGKREEIISADEKQQLKNLQRCFNAGKFNFTALCKLIGSGFSPVTITDFLHGKGVLSRQQLIAIKKAIKTLRNEAQEVLRELERKSELLKRLS